MSFCALASAQEGPVVLGIVRKSDAEKYNAEFMRFDRMVPLYKENSIQASLVNTDPFWRVDESEDQIYETLKKHHVVHLETTIHNIHRLTDRKVARAKTVSAALQRYVREGGGLFIQPRPNRYPNTQDEKYWNLVLEPFGLQFTSEGAYDKTRTYEGHARHKAMFWYTENIKPHPVSTGVKSLYLPLAGFGGFPGVPAMRYSTDWEVVASGEKEARSYKCGLGGHPNKINIDLPGTYQTEPPVLAVRQFGKGRVVSYPISYLFTGINYGNPLWTHTVETKGDPKAGRPSHSMKMQMNSYKWLAEPTRQDDAFGTFRPPPYEPVRFPSQVAVTRKFGKVGSRYVRGIAGVHTAYTDGSGSVDDYVKAAKAAGLSFIVFNDPLEMLTAEKLEQLKADCKKASGHPDSDFYACPGVEFTDGAGIRWAMWGEKVLFPVKEVNGDGFTYTQWDGKRIQLCGQYKLHCGFLPTAVLDYKQFKAVGAHPENQWWFYHHVPLMYERDQLLADNSRDWLASLRDLRWNSPMSFTRIRDPGDVQLAADTCVTLFGGHRAARQALNTRCSSYPQARNSTQQVSQGPEVLLWQGISDQLGHNWRYTRGAQRARFKFIVRSPAGIAEVRVHDADQGLARRFDGHGETQLSREFEMVHDKQHYLALEVIDTQGKRGLSHYIFVWCYKQGLFRCSDNLNILGPTGMVWHPDRDMLFPPGKDFRNGHALGLTGWDAASAVGISEPEAELTDIVNIKGVGDYSDVLHKDNKMIGKVMEVKLGSYQIQIATMHMKNVAQKAGQGYRERAPASYASVPRDLGDIEYFEREHTIYSPADRIDWFVTWDHRRYVQGEKDYKGSFIWHEGQFRFKKDVELGGDVPIPLVRVRCPVDLENGYGDTLIVTEPGTADARVVTLHDTNHLDVMGRIRPGGYISWMNTPVGYHGLLVPKDTDTAFSYRAGLPGWLWIGIGAPNQKIKAGTVIKYRFAFGAFADQKGGKDLLDYTAKAMNMGGGHEGYPVEMKVGKIADATFFFTAQAEEKEALFTLGPRELMIDLPIRVKGLEDNGCAAVYTSTRTWFRFVSVVAGTAYFQESIDGQNEIWAGNILVCDNKNLKLTVVIDGQQEEEKPFVEVHNPTKNQVTAIVSSPEHTPGFGGMSTTVTVPAGNSIWLRIGDDKSLTAMQK